MPRLVKGTQKELDEYKKALEFVKDPMIWELEDEWTPLHQIGFPNYVLTEYGEVFKLNDEGYVERELKQSRRGSWKLKSVTLIQQRKNKPSVYKQYFVAVLVANYFIPKKTWGTRVGYRDDNVDNIYRGNIYWLE